MKSEDHKFIEKMAKEVEKWPEWKKENFGFWETYKLDEIKAALTKAKKKKK